jgi:hypothetical protein
MRRVYGGEKKAQRMPLCGLGCVESDCKKTPLLRQFAGSGGFFPGGFTP